MKKKMKIYTIISLLLGVLSFKTVYASSGLASGIGYTVYGSMNNTLLNASVSGVAFSLSN